MADDRSPLDRLKDAVAAALGRRPPGRVPDDPAPPESPDLRLGRTAGLVAPPVRPVPPPPDEDAR